jgi:hypothetical protein
MATIHRITPHLSGAEDFEVNGHRPLTSNDSSVYFAQAHAFLTIMCTASIDAIEAGNGDLNPMIAAEAISGVRTLLTLGLVAQANEMRNRRAA